MWKWNKGTNMILIIVYIRTSIKFHIMWVNMEMLNCLEICCCSLLSLSPSIFCTHIPTQHPQRIFICFHYFDKDNACSLKSFFSHGYHHQWPVKHEQQQKIILFVATSCINVIQLSSPHSLRHHKNTIQNLMFIEKMMRVVTHTYVWLYN